MILAIVQARMSSTRLPGKVLRPLAGRPSLERQLERIRRARRIDKLIVATSSGRDDEAIVECCAPLGIEVFRGNLENVLDRFTQAARYYRPDHVVRLTADCPLADWRLIDALIEHHLAGGFDYSNNTDPRCYPKGLDAEILTIAALEQTWHEATTAYQKEHVTPYLYQPESRHLFRFGSLSQDLDWSPLRWTLDTAEDYAMIKAVYQALEPASPAFTTEEVMAYLLQSPAVRNINADSASQTIYDRLADARATLSWSVEAQRFVLHDKTGQAVS